MKNIFFRNEQEATSSGEKKKNIINTYKIPCSKWTPDDDYKKLDRNVVTMIIKTVT